MYLLVAQFDEVSICGVWGQSSDVEVRLAQLFLSTVRQRTGGRHLPLILENNNKYISSHSTV